MDVLESGQYGKSMSESIRNIIIGYLHLQGYFTPQEKVEMHDKVIVLDSVLDAIIEVLEERHLISKEEVYKKLGWSIDQTSLI